MSDRRHQQPEGSFLTGLTVGLFAGAAGYYLFATEEGKRLRDRLSSEWEAANEQLAEQGIKTNVSLREFLREVIEKIEDAPGSVVHFSTDEHIVESKPRHHFPASRLVAKTGEKAPRPKTESPHKFRGT